MKLSKRNALLAMTVLALVVLACSFGDETDKANKLVEQGNAAVRDARKFVAEAETTRAQMMTAVASISNKAELEEARKLAKEAIASYDKTKDRCNEAAARFEEASKLSIKDKFKDYLQLKVKEFKVRADIVEAAKGTPLALIDSAGRSSFTAKTKDTSDKVDKLTKEADDLAAQAEKLQKDKPDILKSS